MIRRLRAEHGPVMFHQSGGCCDGSSPMCYPKGDFWTSDADVLLGTIDVREAGATDEAHELFSDDEYAELGEPRPTVGVQRPA